jgi:uncharacterized protein
MSPTGRRERDRDAAGRPLPYGAAGVEGMPDDLALSPEDTFAEAQRLFDAGRAFQAHEVLESTWKGAPEVERELWRGLAQLAVGLTHVQRGNARGAAALLRRAADHVEGYAAGAPHRVDAAGLVAWSRTLVKHIEKDGLATLTREDLTPRLRDRPRRAGPLRHTLPRRSCNSRSVDAAAAPSGREVHDRRQGAQRHLGPLVGGPDA